MSDDPRRLAPGRVLRLMREGQCRLDPAVDVVLPTLHPAVGATLDELTLQLGLRREGGWSRWLAVLGPGPAATDRARIDVDRLVLDAPADALRARAGGAGLHALHLALAGPLGGLGNAAEAGPIRLNVPFRCQRDLPEPLAGRTCCPASLAMVLDFHGFPRPLAQVAAAVRDPARDLYGNWLRAAAVATAAGCPAVVRQARSWVEVAGWLQRGPVIASIAYEAGDLPGAVTPRTEGHLVVITGLDGRGHVLVHDPAGPAGEGLTLDADAFARAWTGHGAVAIVAEAPRTVA